jgi:hypothetical protein
MVRSRIEVLNQHDAVVMHMTAMNLLRCMPSATHE